MKRIADFLEKEQLNEEVLENQRFLVEHKGWQRFSCLEKTTLLCKLIGLISTIYRYSQEANPMSGHFQVQRNVSMNLLHRLLKNNLAQCVNNGHLEDIRIHIFKIEGVVSEMCRYIGIFYAIKADCALVYVKSTIVGRKGRNTGYIERLKLYPAKWLAHGVFDCSGNAPPERGGG